MLDNLPHIGVRFEAWDHVDQVKKLFHQLGFTPQKPRQRALERDAQAVQTWIQTRWNKRLAQGTTRVFLDERGFSLKPMVTRIWVPPVIHAKASGDKLSTIGAVTTGERFLQQTFTGAIRGPQGPAFFEHLLRSDR